MNVHIVYSTDCSGYQHWQSIVAYYSIKRAGHLGPVTRVASGCKPSDQERILSEIKKIDPTQSRFRVHFTPSFAIGGNYKYSNKPGGLHHWITNTKIKEEVIALIDPDMMLLRPITPELGEGLAAVPVSNDRSSGGLVEYIDEHGTINVLREKKLPDLPPRVEKGVAAGQHFGIGTVWVLSGTKGAKKNFKVSHQLQRLPKVLQALIFVINSNNIVVKTFNLTAVCGKDSPCLNTPHDGAYTTREQAESYYSVGPVYLCYISDWKAILPRWNDFTPLVHAQYPKLLAEMYAFTMAAADRQLKFAQSSSFMVSDAKTMSPTESWLWIDEYGKSGTNHLQGVCGGAYFNSLPTETLGRIRNYGYGKYDESIAAIQGPLPVTLHYCQRYLFANHTFAKRKIDHDFFRCDGEPLEFNIEDILKNQLSITKVQKRTAFMICHLIPLMNMALDDYKSDVCS